MSEETTITDSVDAPEVEAPAEVAPEVEAAPEVAETAAPVVQPAKPTAQVADPIDLDAELNAKEALADQLEKGDISYEQYAKACVKHDRKITQAQRELAKPAQQVQLTYQQQQAAKAYWQNWGKGQDVAQMQYGKNVPGARARALYSEVEAEFDANPRYQRAEFQNSRDAMIYDKFCDALATEGTKKPQATRPGAVPTRASGTGGASASPVTTGGKTARQRLQEGEYDLSGDAQRLGMV